MMTEVLSAIERLYRRMLLVVGRGRIKTGKDTGPVQLQQVRLGSFETIDNLPRLAEYGFNSMPPADSDAVVVFVGGNRTDGVIIATGNLQYRMRSLKPGEVSISDNLGQSVFLSQAGIVVNGANLPITVETSSSVTVNAGTDVAVNASGNITASADGDVTVTGSSSVAVTSGGDMTVSASGSLDISASGAVSISGSSISLN